MNAVLLRECMAYNSLMETIQRSLERLDRALMGQKSMTSVLEELGLDLYYDRVPASWISAAYPWPPHRPLTAFLADLVKRLQYFLDWSQNGEPKVMWLSCFTQPSAFLTSVLQVHARKHQISIDELALHGEMLDSNHQIVKAQAVSHHQEHLLTRSETPMAESPIEVKIPDFSTWLPDKAPADGVFVSGLYFESARWTSADGGTLTETSDFEPRTASPLLWLRPYRISEPPSSLHSAGRNYYQCPIYRTVSRSTLSGHATLIMSVLLPLPELTIPTSRAATQSVSTSKRQYPVHWSDPDFWIRRGVALLAAP